MSKELTLEQKIDRAEKLECVFRAIYFIFCALLGFMLIPIGLLLLMVTLHEIDNPLSIEFFAPLILSNLCSAGLLVLSRFSPALMEVSALAVLFFVAELMLAPIGVVLLLRTLLIGRFRCKEAKDLS